ncbi:MAG: alkaline phosphatase family protein [Phycisphaerae bacterium]|nr:alkaline phosphatase family protein [Phycisphaerae bacterium]
MSKIEKVAVFGLDCADPCLMFDKWIDDLPFTKELLSKSTYGNLTSSIPPITVPAWSCMASGKDPGRLGIYGFRNRADHSYDKLAIATSLAVKEKRIWEMMGEHGKESIIVGFPGTYPITRPMKGHMITSFLTPDPQKCEYTWPASLKQEIKVLVGEYLVDVKGFRTEDKQWLLEQIYEMTDKRFKVVKYLVNQKPWDLFWMVEMGHDRIHHGFWAQMDTTHHNHVPDNPFINAIHDYYVHTDKLIADVVSTFDLEKTAIMFVSDHGAKAMVGGFCFNTWLMDQGYLHLKKELSGVEKFDVANIDWDKTTAWGDGGYYGRCFINVKGREPNGQVPLEEYETFRNELKAKIEAIVDHQGKPMGNVAHRPQDLYKVVNRVAPDLVVIFGDLRWRSVGSVGNSSWYTFQNDTGPDDANHAQEGLYLLSHPSLAARGRMNGPTLYDVTPTILDMMKLPIPDDMRGTSILRNGKWKMENGK